MNTLKFSILILVSVTVLAMAPFQTADNNQDHNHHNIVEVASDTESLSTLVAAIEAAGLVETLSGDGPFTVFAPTNEAFDALPDGTLDTLLDPENQDMLIDILTYHVVPGEVMSGDLSDGMMAETVQGSDVSISVSDDGVQVSGANVAQADVEASNGVVHVIDSVILPPEEEDSSGY
ncbi:MAG: fasciclin domain-containing protein [Balneolaceae bacterium]